MSVLWKIVPKKVREWIIGPIILAGILLFWDETRKFTSSDILILCLCVLGFVFVSIPLALVSILFILTAILLSPFWACLYIALEAEKSAALDTLSSSTRLKPISPPMPEVLSLSFIFTSSAPPLLRLHTPYTSDMLILTVHSYKKRQSFYPIPNRFDPPPSNFDLHNRNRASPKHFEPQNSNNVIMWFVEFTCTLKNVIDDNLYVWGQLEEVLPDNTTPRSPHLLRQFLPLSSDEAEDIFAGSTLSLTHAKYSFEVKGTLESTLFFKMDERMQLRTMAFSLYVSPTKQGPYQVGQPLFTIDV